MRVKPKFANLTSLTNYFVNGLDWLDAHKPLIEAAVEVTQMVGIETHLLQDRGV